MAVVPADTVHPPVGGPEVGHVAVADSDVLNVSPVEARIGLQNKSNDTSCHGGRGTGPCVAGCAAIVKISRDDLPLPAGARAVGGGHGGAAGLGVPGYQPILRSTGHGQCPDGVCISITVTVIMIPPTITRSPDKDAPLPIPTIGNSSDKSSTGKITRTINSLPIIVRAPGSTEESKQYYSKLKKAPFLQRVSQKTSCMKFALVIILS